MSSTTASPPASSAGVTAATATAAGVTSSRATFYKRLLSAARQQLQHAPSKDPVALLANLAALIYHSFQIEFGSKTSINWAGFYLVRNVASSNTTSPSSTDPSVTSSSPATVLLLGPFHGLPAVSLIRIGKGVCGSAVEQRQTQVVPDVHAHPNHIACDSASQSEIVVPIFTDAARQTLVGVLDIDSPLLNFFTSEEDQSSLEEIAQLFGSYADWSILDAPIKVDIPSQ